jgi:hypothetical protein
MIRTAFLPILGAVATGLAAGAASTNQTGNYFLKLGDIKGEVAATSSRVLLNNAPWTDEATAARQRNEVTVELGMSMRKPMVDWINASFQGTAARKSGAIIACDFNYKMSSAREFRDALITEIAMPSLDAGDRRPCAMTLKIAVGEMTLHESSGERVAPPSSSTQKKWLPCNFRVKLGDLPCSRVTKIESFSIKMGSAAGGAGAARSSAAPGTRMRFSLPEDDADVWRRDISSGLASGKRQHGTIRLLDEGMADALMLNFAVARLGPTQPSSAAADGTKRVSVELYVQEMSFSLPGQRAIQ